MILRLMAAANYVFVSKDYIKEKLNLQTAQQFFDGVLDGQWGEDWSTFVKGFICPWGADGVYFLNMSSASVHHVEAEQLDHVVESVGAGDSFIGATIAALSAAIHSPLEQAIRLACQVATNKCTHQGFRLSAKAWSEWVHALQTPFNNHHHSATA